MAQQRARWRKAVVATVVAVLVTAQGAAAEVDLGLVQSHIRTAEIDLPAGMSISPAAADGLRACTDEQLRVGKEGPAQCPDASKIGTVEIESKPIPGGLHGSVHVRTPTAERLFRIVLVASGTGVDVKLPGEIVPDPSTGRLTATFEQLPQLPFEAMRLRFFGGQRAVLTTPLECGTYGIDSTFTPWSGTPPVELGTSFTIADRCAAGLPFDPAISAGTVNPVAAASTPFVFRARRDDGRQELERIALTLPPGLTAVLRGVPLCREPFASTGGCAEASRIGTVTVGAGAGAGPLYLPGKAFLTDAYGDGQFGLAMVVPALAGPFDLGTVVVRASIRVDPVTAQLRVVADPLPRILRGVVLRLRDVHLAIDRERFMLNGTNCRRLNVQTTIGAVQGATISPDVPFRLADCAAMPFKPAFSVELTGRGQTRDGSSPGLRVRVKARRGDANLRLVNFTLPPEVAFDAMRGGQVLCKREQLAVRRCPAKSRVGRVRADTPLLNRPLRGPVYFVRGVKGDRFPKLAMELNGEVRIDLLGSTDVTTGGLVTAFGEVPDVPISSFTLKLGPGMLTPTRNLCTRKVVTTLALRGQNGRRVDRRVPVKLPCVRSRR